MTVREVIHENGNWDLRQLESFLPQDLIEEVRAVPILLENRGQDLSYWGCTSNGEFSVSSGYEIVVGLRDHTGGTLDNMKWIWHLRCPERIRVFIWILYLNKLNINEVRARKGMTAYAFCDQCPGKVESIEHVFCECSDAVNIWEDLKVTLV